MRAASSGRKEAGWEERELMPDADFRSLRILVCSLFWDLMSVQWSSAWAGHWVDRNETPRSSQSRERVRTASIEYNIVSNYYRYVYSQRLRQDRGCLTQMGRKARKWIGKLIEEVIFELSLEVNIGAAHGKGRESAFQTLNGLCTKARRPDRAGIEG